MPQVPSAEGILVLSAEVVAAAGLDQQHASIALAAPGAKVNSRIRKPGPPASWTTALS